MAVIRINACARRRLGGDPTEIEDRVRRLLRRVTDEFGHDPQALAADLLRSARLAGLRQRQMYWDQVVAALVRGRARPPGRM